MEAQARVMVDGNWTQWSSFGKWSPYLHRESPPYRERGPVQRWPDSLQLDSKCGTAVQLRIYLYTKNEKVSPFVTLLGVSVRMVDVIPAHGRPINARLHLMPYALARRAPVLRPWMDMAIALASLTNRWGADLLPEEFAQVLRDWRPADDCDPRNLSFAAAAAAQWGFPRGWPTAIWACCVPRCVRGTARRLCCRPPRRRWRRASRSAAVWRYAASRPRAAPRRCCCATPVRERMILTVRPPCRWMSLWLRGTTWLC